MKGLMRIFGFLLSVCWIVSLLSIIRKYLNQIDGNNYNGTKSTPVNSMVPEASCITPPYASDIEMVLSQEHANAVHLDHLTAAVADVRQLLARGEMHSGDGVGLVKGYLDQIDRRNDRRMKWNPVISTAPEDSCICSQYASNVEMALGQKNTNDPKLDLLTATVGDLRQLLTRGEVNSVDLVKKYLDQIDRHNHRGMMLNAVISTAPEEDVFQQAINLDQERAEGRVRGPMHGIPVIIKDTFNTHPALGMETTCGSYALVEAKPRRNAAVVDLLQDAGMIIVAKTSLSELGNFKGFGVTGGWSAVGGQGQSPYVRGGVTPNATFLGQSTPCGSSSGSAIGVAAGFAPISVGSECDGSIVQPACRAALYGMKATPGTIPGDGAFPTSRAFDSHGGMAKTPDDLAEILDLLMNGKDFKSSLKSSWDGIRIGFVDPTLWQPASFVVEDNEEFRIQTYKEMGSAIAKIASAGACVRTSVPLVSLADLAEGNVVDFDTLLGAQYQEVVNEYLEDLEYSPVRSMKDIVEFNRQYAEIELPSDHPGQQVLEGALDSSMSEADFQKALNSLRSHAQGEITKSLADYNIDVILGPADARMASVAAAAGYPVGVVPLGFADFNGRAFGMNIIARAGEEDKIFETMSAWAATFPGARVPPPMLVDWKLGEAFAGG